MKYSALLSLLLLAPLCSAAPNQNDYPVTVQIISSESTAGYQNLQVLIDGQRFELRGPFGKDGVLNYGDYPAKLIKDLNPGGRTTVYELLLPRHKTRKFSVVQIYRTGPIFIPIAPIALTPDLPVSDLSSR